MGGTAGTWHHCAVGADPCAHPQAGRAWWGEPALISRAVQGSMWGCSLKLAHALTSPQIAWTVLRSTLSHQIYCWLYWGDWKESKPAPLRQTQRGDGCVSCPVHRVGKKMLGGDSSLDQCLYLGRTMKKKPLPAALQPESPDAPGASHHTGQGTVLWGQASSWDLPATHPRTLGNRWQLSPHPSILPSLPGPTD